MLLSLRFLRKTKKNVFEQFFLSASNAHTLKNANLFFIDVLLSLSFAVNYPIALHFPGIAGYRAIPLQIRSIAARGKEREGVSQLKLSESVSTGVWCVPGFGAGFEIALEPSKKDAPKICHTMGVCMA